MERFYASLPEKRGRYLGGNRWEGENSATKENQLIDLLSRA
jgi:hypothetical protein